jgi:hypothetical protein
MLIEALSLRLPVCHDHYLGGTQWVGLHWPPPGRWGERQMEPTNPVQGAPEHYPAVSKDLSEIV